MYKVIARTSDQYFDLSVFETISIDAIMDVTGVNCNKTGGRLDVDYNDQFLYLHISYFNFPIFAGGGDYNDLCQDSHQRWNNDFPLRTLPAPPPPQKKKHLGEAKQWSLLFTHRGGEAASHTFS